MAQYMMANLIDMLQRQGGVNMHDYWAPPVDITENTRCLTVYIDIPGVDSDSISVDFFNNVVQIKGNRQRPFSDDTTVCKNEIIYGYFERKIMLPISVTSRSSVTIKAENGMLIITIDKTIEERNRFSVRIERTSSP
jgi:HSP20 family protein